MNTEYKRIFIRIFLEKLVKSLWYKVLQLSALMCSTLIHDTCTCRIHDQLKTHARLRKYTVLRAKLI